MLGGRLSYFVSITSLAIFDILGKFFGALAAGSNFFCTFYKVIYCEGNVDWDFGGQLSFEFNLFVFVLAMTLFR